MMDKKIDVYATPTFGELASGNRYPGRGVLLGKSPQGRAVAAYFIMGRSENSRNRVFEVREDGVYTVPFDPAKVEDPSLIIYRAVAPVGNKYLLTGYDKEAMYYRQSRPVDGRLVVTNGDQTDTVAEGRKNGKCFRQALREREFEPDAPNFTPRISGMLTFEDGDFAYQMSILKSADAEGSACNRYFYEYVPLCGVGHLLHTYECDGNPLPTFQGEPRRVAIPEDIDAFTEDIWNHLDEENKISLYVLYCDPVSGAVESRLINKNEVK